jgi:hypothetical protein
METTPDTRVINVAVLVEDMSPKDLSRVLDLAFEDLDEIRQFTVEGYGWDGKRPWVPSFVPSGHGVGTAD